MCVHWHYSKIYKAQDFVSALATLYAYTALTHTNNKALACLEKLPLHCVFKPPQAVIKFSLYMLTMKNVANHVFKEFRYAHANQCIDCHNRTFSRKVLKPTTLLRTKIIQACTVYRARANSNSALLQSPAGRRRRVKWTRTDCLFAMQPYTTTASLAYSAHKYIVI